MPKRRPDLELFNTAVKIRLPDGEIVEVFPSFRCVREEVRELQDDREGLDPDYLRFTYEAVLERRDLTSELDGSLEAKWDAIREVLGEQPGQSLPPLAYLEGAELPIGCPLAGSAWSEWAQWEDASFILDFAEWILQEREYIGGEGSVLYFDLLAVHPVLRGQGLGIRLLGWACLDAFRSPLDSAVFLVNPMATRYGDRPTGNTRRARNALVRYYKRYGFRVWRPKTSLGPDNPTVCYLLAEDCSLKFADWPDEDEV